MHGETSRMTLPPKGIPLGLVKCLLYQHKYLTLVGRTHIKKKKLIVVVYVVPGQERQVEPLDLLASQPS